MAQKLNSVTPDSKPPDIANPDGTYLDKNEPTIVGSPTLAGIANSIYSFFSAAMVFADISYSGLVDTTTVSQYFQAVVSVINTKITDITDPLTVRVSQNEDDIVVNAGNIGTNSSDIGILGGRITDNDTDINTLQLKTPQSYKTTDTVTFVDLVLTGVTSVKDAIIDLLSRMTNTESATGVNAGNISNNDTDIGNNGTAIGVNAGDINTLELKTPQSYKTTDDVEFKDVATEALTTGGVVYFTLGRVPTRAFHEALSQDQVFDLMKVLVPSDGDSVIVNGSMSSVETISHIIRTSATQITFYGMSGGTLDSFTITDGSASVANYSIVW